MKKILTALAVVALLAARWCPPVHLVAMAISTVSRTMGTTQWKTCAVMIEFCRPGAPQLYSEAPGIVAVAAFLAGWQMPHGCGLGELAIVTTTAAVGRLFKFVFWVTGFAAQNGMRTQQR